MSHRGAEELRDALRIELGKRLAPDGWRQVAADEVRLVGLVRPVAGEFVATLEVLQASSYLDRPPVTVTYMNVGVGYEPLRRLAPLLGMFDLDVQDALVWPPAVAEKFDAEPAADEDALDDGYDEDDEGEQWNGWEVRTVDGARVLASELATVAGERAVPFAERYADVDRLLARMPGPRMGSLCQPALLASAGRFDEARTSLAQLPPPAPGLLWMRDQQRAARQLGRWIESGGDPALIPANPPPPRDRTATSQSLTSVWQQSRATSAAVAAVRRDGAGKDRAELRAMLERELAQRGVDQSPLWFEQTLDHFHDTAAQKGELITKGLLSVAKLGIKAFRGIRDGTDPPDLSLPDWLTPPARAVWAVPRTNPPRWAEVQITDDNADWLDRAYQAIPRLFGTIASLQAWLDWDLSQERTVVVHIGERTIGTLNQSAATAYRPALDAAAERDESPCVDARLTPRTGRGKYLLEVQLPS